MIAHAPPVLSEALCAAQHHLRVHPLHGVSDGRCSCRRGVKCSDAGKHPRLARWQALATTNPEQIAQWWDQYPGANAGVVTGRSSGVVVLEVDPRRGGYIGLEVLEQHYGPLPDTVQVHSGGGGLHYYFRHPGVFVPDSTDVLGAGLEIKADGKANGSNIVLPGSQHASGRRYEWDMAHHPDETALAPLPAHLAVVASPPVTECTECTELTETAPRSVHSVHSVHSVTEAIARTLPRKQGERNRKIFEFCRHLKSIPGYADADPKDLRGDFDQWWNAARATIGTKVWEDSWIDFLSAWPNAWPLTRDPVQEAMERARQAEAPACAAHFQCPHAIDLTRLCRELQQSSGSQFFFISCGKAADVLGIDRMTAWRRLKLLVAEGILEIVEPPTPSRATRYRYVADVEGGP